MLYTTTYEYPLVYLFFSLEYIILFILNTNKSQVKIFSAPKRRKYEIKMVIVSSKWRNMKIMFRLYWIFQTEHYFSGLLLLKLMFKRGLDIYRVWSKNSLGKCVFWVRVQKDPLDKIKIIVFHQPPLYHNLWWPHTKTTPPNFTS